MPPLLFLFLFHLLLLLLPNLAVSECPESFQCGHFSLGFPFSLDPQCGMFTVTNCTTSEYPVFRMENSFYHIIEKISTNKFKLLHFLLSQHLRDRKCFPFFNVSLPNSPSISFKISSNLTSFFACSNQTTSHHIEQYFQGYHSFYNEDYGPSTVYYLNPTPDSAVTEKSNVPKECWVIEAPIDYSKGNSSQMLELLTAEFTLEWNISKACYDCYHDGGLCLHNTRNEFFCKKEFPFTDVKHPDCGLFHVSGCKSSPDDDYPRILVGPHDSFLRILGMISTNKFSVRDLGLNLALSNGKCYSFSNTSMLQSPSVSFTFSPNLTLFTCYKPYSNTSREFAEFFQNYKNTSCDVSDAYYKIPGTTRGVAAARNSSIPRGCFMNELPVKSENISGDLFDILNADFIIEWSVSKPCTDCYHGGGLCLADSENKFFCKKENNQWKVIVAICVPVSLVLLILVAGYIIWQRKKKLGGTYLLGKNTSFDPSSRSDIEDGSFNFGIPIFSYTELVEATSNFDSSKELGDGGFGTVYYGQLKDGREVAIKRLYEHNYRRVEQFLNEIKILTSLRHPNLVSLYGCTSRRSRELLLVYEYIPNGTVADHLHGERAKEAPLTWPVRMSIARETANALAYLHKSDIIHRDVKTNNILLDNNFSVKVADFGLSRLFPFNVTHISTAPQGTPGYVDPEYHQCYQLTDKSDVYSFGVVLIELISSMPAVDISRHKHEINLANLAVNKIQKCAFDELIDPSTGYNSDPEVTRMTTSVAELAFRCLQLEKDLRPRMEEVVAFLKDIQNGQDCDFEHIKEGSVNQSFGKIPPSPETDDVVLLKSKNYKSSPTAVTDTWISSASTTASSVG